VGQFSTGGVGQFYSGANKVDPRALDYRVLDTTTHPDGVRQIGRFRFEPISPADVANARLVDRVGDSRRAWFLIYSAPGDRLIVRRVPMNDIESSSSEFQQLLHL